MSTTRYTSIVPAATCACLVTKGHSSTAFLSCLQSISSMEDVPEKWGYPSGECVPFVSVSGDLSFRGECPLREWGFVRGECPSPSSDGLAVRGEHPLRHKELETRLATVAFQLPDQTHGHRQHALKRLPISAGQKSTTRHTSIVPAATCACLVTKAGHSSTAFPSYLQ